MACHDCEEPMMIPVIVHEASMAQAERHAKRQAWLIGILIFILLATNLAWLWYESQFEYVETTSTSTEMEQIVTQDAETGNNSFVGGDYYGETDSINED